MSIYDPNKKQTINAKEAYKLGLIDKEFSGSVRRTNADIAFAQGKNIFDAAGGGSNPNGYNYNVPNKPSKPSATKSPAIKREKATAVNTGLTSMGIQKPVGDFKISGAISSSMGGNTDYQAGLENLSKSINTKTAEAPQQSAPKSRKEMRQERRVARLENRQAIQKEKGELALSEGRTMDAKQKRYRYDRLQKRIDRNKKK